LGLIAESRGIAARVLQRFGVTAERVDAELDRARGRNTDSSPGQLPFKAEANRAVELSLEEATILGYNQIKTEHLLLALLRINNDTAVQILTALGVNLELARAELIRLSRNRMVLLAEARRSEFGTWEPVGPTDGLHNVLFAAAELAIDGGRARIDIGDVLLAIARDRRALPLLSELGVQIEAVEGVVARHIVEHWPPEPGTPD
jgi:ATP-dependent Clp protease ATP-binding subunit ClpC